MQENGLLRSEWTYYKRKDVEVWLIGLMNFKDAVKGEGAVLTNVKKGDRDLQQKETSIFSHTIPSFLPIHSSSLELVTNATVADEGQ